MEQTAPEGVTPDLLQADDLSEVVEARTETEVVEQKPEKDPEKQKEIDHNLSKALKEERRLRREQDAKIAAQEQRWQLAEQRLAQMEALRQQAQKPQVPDFDTDPLVNLKATTDQLAEQQRQIAQMEQQRFYAAQQEQAQAQMVNWYQTQANEFAKEAPDFGDAYQFLLQRRQSELSAMGLSPQEIAQTVARDEIWIVQNAAQRHQNPAELIYNMAKNTGYQAKANGQQKIDTMKKGLEASKTLGSGGQSNGKITLEQLANMPQDEFDAYCNKNGGMEKVMASAR